MNKFVLVLIGVSLLTSSIILSGCVGRTAKEIDLGTNANANSIVPDLENYQAQKGVLKNEGSTIGGKISEEIANLGGVPAPFAPFIGRKTKQFIECVADEGAGSITWYHTNSDPLDNTVLAVGEGDLSKLLKCVVKTGTAFSIVSPTAYGMYAHSYIVKNTANGNNFYILFLGTTNKGSYALCDKLPGCKKEEMFSVIVYTE